MSDVKVLVENNWGVVEGLDYSERKSCADALDTQIEIVGTRLKFAPTRFALDHLVATYGKDVFAKGCRFAWAHLYAKKQSTNVEFNFVTEPYAHQREWFTLIKDLPFFAFEWEMGLGKSKTALDVAHWAYTQGEIDAVLIVTLKDVHRKWVEKEVATHLPPDLADAAYWKQGVVDAGMWTGTSRQRTPLNKSKKLAIAAINFDVIHRKKGREWATKFLRERKCLLIVDESQHMKTPSAQVTKVLHKLAPTAVRRFILTGTMAPNGPVDAWSQYKFLHPSTVNNWAFHEFRDTFCEMREVQGVTYDGWEYDKLTKTSIKVKKPVLEIASYKNEKMLCEMLDPYRSRLLKTDCLDLPEKIYRMRSFEMSDEMRSAYTSMSKAFIAELADGKTMTASMAIVRLIRLQQIVCGFAVPDDADPQQDVGEPLGKQNPRLNALMSELESVSGKGIIWAYWRYSLREIADALRTAYGDSSVVEYHGGVDDATKAANLKEFEKGNARWFVGNPQSGGTGIDLVAAQDMFYYNNSFNLGLRLQSEDRFHRIGQTGSSCTITDLECLGSIDREQLRALKDKQNIAAVVSGDVLKQWLTSAV